MPTYARDKNGVMHEMESEHVARLFGMTPVSFEEYSGVQARPGFASLINPATGKLQDQFTLKSGESLLDFSAPELDKIQLNTEALEELRTRSKEKGPSKWAQLATTKALDDAQREGGRAEAQALSNLAMFGGVSGGERERIGYQSARDIAESRQAAKMGIDLQDEQTKLGILKALPGMEVESLNPAFRKAELRGRAKESDISRRMQADQFNIGLTAQDIRDKNMFDMQNYQEQMKKWAAEQESKATKNAGGGSHICTAVHREYTLTDDDLNIVDEFRAAAMDYFPEVFKFYLLKCEELIPRMKAAGADVGMLRPFVNLVLKYIDKFGMDYALDFYADYVIELLKVYMPEHAEEAINLVEKAGSN